MSDTKPNILFVMADQLAAQFLPFHGHRLVKTPNLSRLAAEGVVFENAYSTSPLCSPARATVMNGLLPSRTGVYDNAAEFPSSIPTWAHYLRLAGYKTCLSGKMHFVGPDQLHGLEERLTTDIYPADFGWTPDWRLAQERIDWWYHNMTSVLQPGIAEITNQLEFDDEVAFLAIRKIYDYARFEPDKPFCLMASFTHPHDPYAARRKFWDLYRDEDIDLPAVPRMERACLDAHSRRLHDVSAMDDYTVTEDDLRKARHGYYANISYVDDLLGQMIAALEACGKLDDTAIVFTSDHGDFLGERGLWYKMSYLEPSAHVPMLVWNPKRFKARRVKEPVTLADILPTLVDIGNEGETKLARTVDGRSLHPLLTGAPENPEATAWGEYLAEGAIAPMYMLRRGPWKFIHSPADPDQLYNLEDDPGEIRNIAGTHPLAGQFRAEVEAKFDIARINAQVLESQQARHMMFEALKRGSHFPWDFQPLRDASEQYTRNHMSVTDRDLKSRFPHAPDIEGKRRK
ncbi:choline-sulfatase [Aestuariivirga sp.]|uniref:choline-sulfatase n=1 Tax=Aestuariivirga sp. TaxID=2650926 RepID=UPI0025B82430|nr:choline-sulfatase [Aestuariivirga sp.]MCA3555819.1 choline-sulfatase [Aestuariivirga sp.]